MSAKFPTALATAIVKFAPVAALFIANSALLCIGSVRASAISSLLSCLFELMCKMYSPIILFDYSCVSVSLSSVSFWTVCVDLFFEAFYKIQTTICVETTLCMCLQNCPLVENGTQHENFNAGGVVCQARQLATTSKPDAIWAWLNQFLQFAPVHVQAYSGCHGLPWVIAMCGSAFWHFEIYIGTWVSLFINMNLALLKMYKFILINPNYI